MAKMKDTRTMKPLTKLALIGALLYVLFLAGLAGFYYYAGFIGEVSTGVMFIFAPLWFFSYLIVISGYSGFFMAKLAQGRWKYPWLWGISGGILTSLLMEGFAPVFQFSSLLSIVIVSFVAPILSTLLIGLLISVPRRTTL